MKPRKLQMIVFDLFGVILTEGHLISHVLTHLLPKTVNKSHLKTLYNAYNLAELNEAGFWQALGLAEHTLIRQSFLQSFQLDPDYAAVISVLKPHFRLAILSNLPADWADALSARFKFETHFSPCLFSGHLRCKKPQPGIYQQLISQSGIPAERMAFIDDRLENLQTAAELGMTTIYYQREQESHGFLPDYCIHKLADLLHCVSEVP